MCWSVLVKNHKKFLILDHFMHCYLMFSLEAVYLFSYLFFCFFLNNNTPLWLRMWSYVHCCAFRCHWQKLIIKLYVHIFIFEQIKIKKAYSMWCSFYEKSSYLLWGAFKHSTLNSISMMHVLAWGHCHFFHLNIAVS